MCAAADADIYLSGPFGKNYHNAESFLGKEINVKYHDYAHPIYEQRSIEFMTNMSRFNKMQAKHSSDARMSQSFDINTHQQRKRTVKYTLQFLFSFLLDSGCFHFLFYPEVRQ